jgi:hypothetical protein
MKKLILIVLFCGLLFGLTWIVAASPDQLTLPWWTVDGGGATFSTGGGYTLGGTIGQPDAGVLTGDGYILGGGFWRGGVVAKVPHQVYLPLVLR